MKLAPRRDQILGRFAIERRQSAVTLTDESKGVAKFIFVDAVGPEAEAAGIKVGDMLAPRAVLTAKGFSYPMTAVVTYKGVRALIREQDVAATVPDLDLEEFSVQTDSLSSYVPFDSDQAAQSIGVGHKAAPESGRNGGGAVAGAPV